MGNDECPTVLKPGEVRAAHSLDLFPIPPQIFIGVSYRSDGR
jgi:hypothetical protein